jgi:hypothetical protein
MAEEARVFERSEFPRRAISGEERRGPAEGRLVSALAVLATFAKTKVARAAKPRESLCLLGNNDKAGTVSTTKTLNSRIPAPYLVPRDTPMRKYRHE